MKSVVRYLRRVTLRERGDRPTDGQLLDAFLTRRDEAAFEILLRRHGPMVLGVCRRTLRNQHDAEDAFQATFLILVRKASTIRPREMVGNWLYGVAYRTAMKARAMNIKRRMKESHAYRAPQSEDSIEGAHDEILKHLDAELSRLPDKYRVPVLLCELEGKSRREAARLLRISEGTLSWRLAWARKMLARRLSRRGIALPATALTAALAAHTAYASVPPLLLGVTARTALRVAAGHRLTAGVVSAQVVTLTEGVLKAMLLGKLKVLWATALLVTLGTGATGVIYRAAAADPQPRGTPQKPRLVQDDLEELRLEIEALRKGLHATRERVKSLETELDTVKRQQAVQGVIKGVGGLGLQGGGTGLLGYQGGALGLTGGANSFGGGMGSMGPGGARFQGMYQYRSTGGGAGTGGSASPLADAQKALKELEQHPDNKQAAEVLERAVEWLKKRPKSDEKPGK
jgi:RNA polymerase sigma-70 factor (ECF subfamily)